MVGSRLAFVLLSMLAIASPPSALAVKGGSKPLAPLALVSESTGSSLNALAPTWCLNEDDYHQRAWSGSLSGTFSATEQLCDATTDYSGGIWWDAGGIGIQTDLYVVGSLTDVAIVSPQGDAHHGVFMGSTTSRGVKTSHYEACYVPPFSLTYDVGGTPLPGGSWQIALSGSMASARFSVTAEMADTWFQQQYCPPSEQNLTH